MTAVIALVPDPVERVDLEGAALRDWLADRYALPGDAWLRLDLVGALGGQSTGASGTSEDLTGGIDRTVLGVLRAAADVVLVGAGTLRGEALPAPRTRPLAVATSSGDLPADRVPDGGRVLVLCPAPAADGLRSRLGGRAEVVPLPGDPTAEPGLITAALVERGLPRIVCEGGGRLAGRLIAAGLELMAAVPEPVHPRDPAIRGLKHVIWLGADRSAVAIAPGYLDRSPCGTGTSARMAQLHARGELAIGERFLHRSVIGSQFTGRLVAETEHGVIPEITGRAWITGTAEYVLDPTDPFPAGFRL